MNRSLYNRPSLRIKNGHAIFHPASGMCPWQRKRFQAKITLNSMYGKFGSTTYACSAVLDSEGLRCERYAGHLGQHKATPSYAFDMVFVW